MCLAIAVLTSTSFAQNNYIDFVKELRGKYFKDTPKIFFKYNLKPMKPKRVVVIEGIKKYIFIYKKQGFSIHYNYFGECGKFHISPKSKINLTEKVSIKSLLTIQELYKVMPEPFLLIMVKKDSLILVEALYPLPDSYVKLIYKPVRNIEKIEKNHIPYRSSDYELIKDAKLVDIEIPSFGCDIPPLIREDY